MKILILGKNTLFFFIDDITKLSIIKKGTYLNTAYMGLMSLSLSNYRRDYEKGYLNEGDSYKFSADNLLSDTHVNLSNFLGPRKKILMSFLTFQQV